MVNITCAGAYKGVVTLASLDCSVGDLRKAIADKLGLTDLQEDLKLIVSGKTLKEDHKALSASLIREGTKCLVLAAKSGSGVAALLEQGDKALRLERLKAAAAAIAARDETSSTGSFRFEIENQAGAGLHLAEADQKALGMGLALHSRGQHSLKQGCVGEALQELLLAEEAFDLVPESITEGIDNIALLLLDIVWCHFLLRDNNKLAEATIRLQKVRSGLHRAHGLDMSRLRVLHGGFRPETAIYMRLELLEGVAAFHRGDSSLARKKLLEAKARWESLQISDDSLAALLEMGFTTKQATRALRFCAGDLNSASEHALEQKQLQKKRKLEDEREATRRKEQRRYKRTAGGALVNMQVLDQLATMLKFDRALIAAALIETNNNGDAALDVLTDSSKREQLFEGISATESRKKSWEVIRVQLLQMGYSEGVVKAAEESSGSSETVTTLQQALDWIQKSLTEDIPGEVTETAKDLAPEASEAPDQEFESNIAAGIQEDPLSAYDVDVHHEGTQIRDYLAKLEES